MSKNSWIVWIVVAVIVVVIVVAAVLLAIYIPQLEDRVPYYVLLNNLARLAFMDTTADVINSTVQNGGKPIVTLFKNPGKNRVPVYGYLNQFSFSTWGTSSTAPFGQKVENGGLPVGYVSSVPGSGLSPVYQNIYSLTGTEIGIFTHQVSITIAGITYNEANMLGYSF